MAHPPTQRTVTVSTSTTTRQPSPVTAQPSPVIGTPSNVLLGNPSQTSSPGTRPAASVTTIEQTPASYMLTPPGVALAQQRLADLLASVRDIPALNPLDGIMSGPGNQGSATTANLQGHAGTPGTFIGVPREMVGPGIGGGTPQ